MPSDSPQSPAPLGTLSCDVAVLFGDAETAGGLIDRLRDAANLRANDFTARIGRLGERVVAIGIAGTSSLASMTESIVRAHKPQLVVFGTFGVGLAEGLAVATVLLADCLASETDERVDLMPAGDSPLRRGTLQATSRLGSLPADVLAAIPPDIYPAARWCRDQGLAVQVAAVITRHATLQPPADVRQVLGQRSLAGRAGALLGAAWRRPRSVPDLWRHKETVWRAREKLGDAIERLVA